MDGEITSGWVELSELELVVGVQGASQKKEMSACEEKLEIVDSKSLEKILRK
jgi:hypothetical protein